jgi:DNA-binding transcriptional MocR family regulator
VTAGGAPGVAPVRLSAEGRRSVVPAPVNRMMAAFAATFRPGIDVNLGVGYVNEETLPRAAIERAVSAVLAEPLRHPHALNYGGSAGAPNLVAALRRMLAARAGNAAYSEVLDRRRLVIGGNGATSLLEAAAAVLPRGCVVISDPGYYIYADYLRRRGFSRLSVPEDHDGLRTEWLAAHLPAVQDRLSFVYVVGVANPTGAVLSNARRRELVALVTEASRAVGRQIPLFFDGAYELVVHDPAVAPLESPQLHDPLGLVYELGTLSKALSPALRIGWLVGPDTPLVDAIVQRTSDVGFSASLLNQEVASYLLEHDFAGHLARVNAGYRDRAQAARRWIDRHLGSALEDVIGGEAGFYLYLTLRDVETVEGSAFHRYAARCTGDPAIDGAPGDPAPRVLYVPGQLCVDPEGELSSIGRRQLRLSYGYEGREGMERGIATLGEAIAFARSSASPRPAPRSRP